MKIVSYEVRTCTQRMGDPTWKFARATVPVLDGHVLALTDEAGNVGLGYAHAIPAISSHGAGVAASLKWFEPMVLGQDADEMGAIIEKVDAALAFNVTSKAAIDMALHDLQARRLGIPLNVLLGGSMRSSIPQSRILAIKSPLDMATKAASLAAEGYGQLKIKLSGDAALDAARVGAIRDAVGPDIILTLDPNQSYSAKLMMGTYARIERFDITLIEQPVPAADWAGLKLLTQTLPVAIEADESAQTIDDVFKLVSERVVDVINVKVTKFGGLRRFMQAVQICTAGGVSCRVGAAFGPALLQAVATHAASVIKTLPYGCELSEHQHLLDDPFTALPLDGNRISVPGGPGCGVSYA